MKKSIIIVIVVVLIAALAAGAGFYFYNKNKDDSEESKKNETSQSKEDKDDGEDEDKKEDKKEKESSSTEDIIEDLAKALASKEDLEKFLKNNMDFEAYAAMDSIDSDSLTEDAEDYDDYADAYVEAFEKALEDQDEDDVGKDDILEEAMEVYEDYIEEGLTVSEVGKEEDCKVFPMFKKVAFVLLDEDDEELEYTALMHDGKFVIFLDTSSIDTIESLIDSQF